MSVYAVNLLRELVEAGHDVTMVSQYRGDPAGAGIYGGGPPPPVPGVRVLGPEEGVDDKQFQREVGAALSADRMRSDGALEWSIEQNGTSSATPPRR